MPSFIVEGGVSFATTRVAVRGQSRSRGKLLLRHQVVLERIIAMGDDLSIVLAP